MTTTSDPNYVNFITEGMRFVDADETGMTYYYYGYTDIRTGAWQIRRYKSDESEMRYCSGDSNYSTNWTNRASLTYTV